MKQFEFLVLYIESLDKLAEHLNLLGKRGWSCAGIAEGILVLQRENPNPEETNNELSPAQKEQQVELDAPDYRNKNNPNY